MATPYRTRNSRRFGAIRGGRRDDRWRHTFAALDLGTNNCRLLVARPSRDGFRVIDSFSRIVRLGQGLGASGVLAEDAIEQRHVAEAAALLEEERLLQDWVEVLV